MPFIVVGLLIVVLACGFSYPFVRKRMELKARESEVNLLLQDNDPDIRARAEAIVKIDKLKVLGLIEARQAADILEMEQIRELIGDEEAYQTIVEVLRSNANFRREDVKLLAEKND